jgi:hypothetical protein
LVDTVDVDAETDEQAVAIARARVNCDTVEIWGDDRRLQTVGRGQAADFLSLA